MKRLLLAALLFAACKPHVDLLRARPYTLKAPKSYDPKHPAPLVLLLHGLGGAGASVDEWFQLSAIADARGFFLALPDGTLDGQGRRFWNASEACCDFEHRGVDDVAYLTAIVEDVSAKWRVDAQRVFAAGFSNGGFMAHRLACEPKSRFAAIASMAGAGPGSCAATRPVAVLELHGDRDRTVPIDGGSLGIASTVAIPPARATVAAWAARDGCDATPIDGAPIDLDSEQPGPETRVLRFANCRAGAVELWTVTGADHFFVAVPGLADRVYDFLAAHPRR